MNNTFLITITGVDKFTKVANSVQKSIDKFQKPFKDLNRSVAAFSKGSGLDKLVSGFASVVREVLSLTDKIAAVASPLNAIVGGGALAGLTALVAKWGEFGFEVSRTSQSLGISASTLQQLRGAAQLAGLSTETLTSSFAAFGTTLQDATYGRNNEALYLMNRIGLVAHKSADGVIDTTSALMDLSRAIKNTPAPLAQQKLAAAFGVGELLPLLRQGPEAIRRLMDQARGLGAALDTTAADRFGQSLARMKLGLEGAGYAIADKLLPKMEPLVNKFTDWASANRGVIASNVEEFADNLIAILPDLGNAVAFVGRHWKLFAGLFVASQLAPIFTAIASLTTAMIALAGATALTPIGLGLLAGGALIGGAALIGSYASPTAVAGATNLGSTDTTAGRTLPFPSRGPVSANSRGAVLTPFEQSMEDQFRARLGPAIPNERQQSSRQIYDNGAGAPQAYQRIDPSQLHITLIAPAGTRADARDHSGKNVPVRVVPAMPTGLTP